MSTPAEEPAAWVLPGQVIGLFERDGRRVARVALRPGTAVEVESGVIPEVRLGDPVLVEARVVASSVRPDAPDPEERDPRRR